MEILYYYLGESFFVFLLPYILICLGITLFIMQSLEGLGLHSSTLDTYSGFAIDVAGTTVPLGLPSLVFTYVAIYIIALILLVLMSAYILGRLKGILLALVIILIPCFLSSFEVLPNINYIPEEYVINGTGVLGSWKGATPLLIMGIITGWCINIIIYDTFRFSDNFRQWYDHIWYLSGVIAILFFVFDADSNRKTKELEEINQDIKQASIYLLQQIKGYNQYCINKKINSESCKWSSNVQQLLHTYISYNSALMKEFGPNQNNDIYNLAWAEASENQIIQIRKEINDYNNQHCPITQISKSISKNTPFSSICLSVPGAYLTQFPAESNGLINKDTCSRTLALSSECLIPTLVHFKKLQDKTLLKVKENALTKHYRLIYFFIFSIIVGGKIANSTTKAIGIDKRPNSDRKRLLLSLNWIPQLFKFLFKKFSK